MPSWPGAKNRSDQVMPSADDHTAVPSRERYQDAKARNRPHAYSTIAGPILVGDARSQVEPSLVTSRAVWRVEQLGAAVRGFRVSGLPALAWSRGERWRPPAPD